MDDTEDTKKFEMIKAADEFVASFIQRFRGGDMVGSETLLWGILEAIDQSEVGYDLFEQDDIVTYGEAYLEDKRKAAPVVAEPVAADVPGQMFFAWEGESVSARSPDFFVGDNDHGDAVPTNPTVEDIMMRNQELSMRVWELERRLNAIERHAKHMKIADCIVSSEPFSWLMVGSNHVQSNIAMLREAYAKWQEAGGQTFLKQSNQYLDELARLDEELGLV